MLVSVLSPESIHTAPRRQCGARYQWRLGVHWGSLLPVLLSVAALAALGARPAAAVDLPGTWYVLIHYTDASTANPDVLRWEDRLWEFEEKKGGTLVWTDYPLVVFRDKTGRWDGRRRVLHAWEPSATQWAEVAAGLQVNSRGKATKALRRSAGNESENWHSGGTGAAIPGTLTYTRTWTIENAGSAPIFQWSDSLGGASKEDLSGVTRFSTHAVEAEGDLIVGTYERDGHKTGTFRMVRAASSRGLPTTGKTPNQKSIERAYRQMLQGRGAEGKAMRDLLVDALQASLADYRIDPRGIDTKAVVDAALERVEPESIDDIPKVIEREIMAELRKEAFAFATPGAVHDAEVRYRLPFDTSVSRKLTQGINGSFSHRGRHEYSFDFDMPVGTPVQAARPGRVVSVIDGFTQGGPTESLAGRANLVRVLHDDGTYGEYVHLAPGIAVQAGESVAAGNLLGSSGNTGYTAGPHLHFAVWRMDEEGDVRTLPIRFDDGSERGVEPLEGLYYP